MDVTRWFLTMLACVVRYSNLEKTNTMFNYYETIPFAILRSIDDKHKQDNT